MATINSQILKDISQNETVFSEAENKVFQWKEDIQDWNSTSYFTEQAILSVGDKFKADSPDGQTTKIVIADKGISGSVNATAALIGGTHGQIKTALAKFDPTDQNSGILNFQNTIWSRKWAGKVNDTLFEHSSPGGIYISDTDSLLDASSSPAPGAGADNKWLIIDTDASTTIDSYFGDAVLSSNPVVPEDTIFYISTAEASNYTQYPTSTPTDVKPGFYKTAASSVTLAADIFKNSLGSEVIPAAHDGSALNNADTRAAAEVFAKANLLDDDDLVSVASEPNVDLAAPSTDNDFWTRRLAVASPIKNDGTSLGAAFTIDATAETLGTADYWNIVSSGLAQDIIDTNNTLWSETNVAESSNALKYRG